MSGRSARSRLLAATLSCTLGFGVLAASLVGAWYAQLDHERRAIALGACVQRGEQFAMALRKRERERAQGAAALVAPSLGQAASRALFEIRARYPADWIMLADERGQLLASSREQGPRESLLGLDGVRRALRGRVSTTLWLFKGESWLVALAPIRAQQKTLGIVMLGERIDERFAKRLANAAGAPVWLALGQNVISSKQDCLVDAELVSIVSQSASLEASRQDAEDPELFHLEAGALVRSKAFIAPGGRVGYLSTSEDGLPSIPWWRIGLLGLLGVLAGLVNWRRLAGGITRILDRMVYGLFEAAEGRLEAEVDFESERGFFAELASAYRRMQHELRQRIERLTRAAEHRELAMQAKDKFLASISHELRTPLTSVRAYAELLLHYSHEGRSEQETEFLEIIQAESDRLTRLIDEVMDLTKMEAGTLEWGLEEFDLRELTQDVMEGLERKSSFKSIEVCVEAAQDCCPYRGDRRRLGQALEHLLDNAIKFSPVGGRVNIRISQQLTTVELRVEDSGPGVPSDAEKLAIFEKFYQRGDALTDRPEGTGLGLALVRGVAEAHAGRVFCEDGRRGGAVFVLRLAKAGECRRDVDHVEDGQVSLVEAFTLWGGH